MLSTYCFSVWKFSNVLVMDIAAVFNYHEKEAN